MRIKKGKKMRTNNGIALRLDDILLNDTSEYDAKEYRHLSDVDRRK